MERLWLADLLQRHLQALMPDRVVTLQPDMGAVAKPTVQIEVLGPAGAIPEPPSDCAVRLYTEWDRVEFVRGRAFSLASYGFNSLYLILHYGLDFILFIPSMLVIMLEMVGFFLELRHSWFLLIPFGVIGLCIFLLLCVPLTVPFGVERWAMIPGEIIARFSICGMGRSRRIEAKSVGRVELRNNARIRKWDGDTPYSLGLVGREGQDLLVVVALTEGEARWMGGQMCELLKGSLPRAGETTVPPSRASHPLCDREFDR